MFDNAAKIPFASYRLVTDWARYGDLARARERSKYTDVDDIAIPLTEERYRIRGFDRLDAVEDVFFTFVRRDDEWFVAEDSDLEDVGIFSVRHAWHFAAPTIVKSRHFLGLGPPCGAVPGPCIEDLLPMAEEALERVDRAWKAPWRHRVVLMVPPSDAALKRMLQATFDPADFVAFAYSTVDPRDLSYRGHRIIVNPPVIAGRPRDQVVTIMAHELLHVATRSLSGPFVPLFVDEGIAEAAAHFDLDGSLGFFDAIVAGGSFDEKLPEDFQFSTGTATEIFLSYQESLSAIEYFINRWGLDRFTRFYERLGRARLSPGLASWHVERALRSTIGMGLERFEKAWASSITS